MVTQGDLTVMIIGTMILCIGILLNGLTFFMLQRVELNSLLTAWLYRTQPILDAICCVGGMIMFWINELDRSTEWIARTVCYIWRDQFPLWFFVVWGQANLTWITMDRLWATVYYVTYRRYQKRYLIVCTVGSVVYSLLLNVPSTLYVRYNNGTCETSAEDTVTVEGTRVQLNSIYWFFAYYLLPMVTMFVVYIRVVYFLRHIRTTHSVSNLDTTEQQQQKQRNTNMLNPVYQSLSVATFGFIISLLLTHTVDTLYYLIGANLNLGYEYGASIQMISVFVTTLSSILNPLVILFSLPALRKTLTSCCISAWTCTILPYRGRNKCVEKLRQKFNTIVSLVNMSDRGKKQTHVLACNDDKRGSHSP
ncbi:unnamed protein product [Echinostoma caproni]|uniref:G_PROTEIN_RECEP_F1_2 domain-containing protein n=1 Tax=Echinostoma caproni TaxID=27848 RepID=A0A183AJ23_9TREM|nr:unnamed protein product [Echinostoma caproni]